MRLTALISAALLSVALVLSGCSSSSKGGQSTSSPQSSVTSPQVSAASRSGTFTGLNGKQVAGKVTVTDGQIVLSNFSSDEGPDLYIYLANGTDESAVAAGKVIASVAFDKSSQTFPLSGVDESKYTTVVIHCDKAKASFGAATLS
ncbi:DM13 domain-containing protein [Mycolicibacterium goodii]|uniref:DM13 domain-containing protein n=1 Tax=Mycolicibacterium goodii TaxID=134601 RepID=UPI001BDBD62F|nr:DM13 domain-containing protein [Mycolicibacterium goodii]MBU8834200.1 DM13 domain-containing protein [Mycolicibacterium goodii]